jgi:hypothetical protein
MILVLCVAAPRGMIEASPIRHHQVSSESAPKHSAWNTFLVGGPMMWAHVHPPKITLGIREIMDHALASADPTSNMNVEYLLWRESLNPRRFDHWHPRMSRHLHAMLRPASVVPTTNPGSALEPELIAPPTSMPATLSSSVSSPTVSSPTTASSTSPATTAPDTLGPSPSISPSPSAIPEPETMTIALLLIGSGLWWRSRSRAGRLRAA